MGRSSRSGEPIDPFGNAVSLAQHAERRAKSNRDVAEMIAASNQWLSIVMVHNEMSNGDKPNRSVGFTGGNND